MRPNCLPEAELKMCRVEFDRETGALDPILTTVTDICGFFLTLGLAALAMANGYL